MMDYEQKLASTMYKCARITRNTKHNSKRSAQRPVLPSAFRSRKARIRMHLLVQLCLPSGHVTYY